MYKNILAIDLGKHRCGFAISRTGIIVTPLANFTFEKEKYDLVINKIKEIIEKENIEHIVLGYPLYPSGDKCEMTSVVESFKELLSKELSLPIYYQDERDSTLVAKSFLHTNGINSKKQKNKLDMTASCVILSRFIENNNK